jgi:hypothetical protein
MLTVRFAAEILDKQVFAGTQPIVELVILAMSSWLRKRRR